MIKAKLIFSILAICIVIGGMLSFKVSRITHSMYEVDANNPNPALRQCTKLTNVFYSTVPIINGQPAIVTLPYYTTSVNQLVCPTTILFSAL